MSLKRILWYSCHPALGTGYATQTAIWCRYLRDAGYDVAIASYFGGIGHSEWEGIPVFPPAVVGDFSNSLLGQYAKKWKADLIIALCDLWITPPRIFADYPVLAWAPIDTSPLSLVDAHFLYQVPATFRPVAMSRFGQAQLEGAGVKAPCVYHGIDTVDTYRTDPERIALRAAFGIREDEFCIGINANNIDPVRKGMPEQFKAFAMLAQRRPNAILYVHSAVLMKNSLHLMVLAQTLGIQNRVRFADQDRLNMNGYSNEDMRHWYCAMDLISNCSYGEGFGLVPIEAQACGTPVVVSDGSTGPEIAAPCAWKVKTSPFWNWTHNSWWHRPDINGIFRAYDQAASLHHKLGIKRQVSRQFAERFDYRVVGPAWLELLEEQAALAA